ncbi:Type IV secretory pathway ATPase VirB11/Archaellum biosynthesis ATPase [Natronoarchaeum philippinense]|uniref:Type IV secretory pathway ATPase VirB11/Archaellum biosynthesis ATPase n=1 Tax=Natronoarchaeum philippinense TaxID=558529 RepID=A0A285NT81_NATPI|nr:type II/IV secretion system ATPase subunit [Natronoarchaeum philippinense]SNZ12639.1 Type IV secretory pathway ATPase VirB11/Archaellum biosynthesis ATPase [Natronoarchaeum philippinense]
MTDGPSLEVPTTPRESIAQEGDAVPPPLPPDDPEAWYASDVREQYELYPGVVATIYDREEAFEYEVREPPLSATDVVALETIRDYFEDAALARPLTREGTVERMNEGFDPKYEQIIDRLVSCSAAARRRVGYRAFRDLRCLGELTPLAVDDRIEVADTADDRLVVHTENYAPARTTFPAEPKFIERFVSERLTSYTVSFQEFEVPVVIYREHLLGRDSFTTKYAVQEPDLLPGDETLVEECKERIWEANVDGLVDDRKSFVRSRARTFLSRQLTARRTRAWVDATRFRLQRALAEYDLAVPPIEGRYSADRLSDLVYYVLRDYVGEGTLTVPIRDRHLEDIEANRVGERIKVLPRGSVGHDERMPTNLAFEDESTFINVVTQLAAADGTELNASNPSAKVNLAPEGVPDDVTIRCAVALGVISEDGPHISIRKQSPEAMTPIDLLERGSVSEEMVALLWMLYEHHGVVLFSGPTGVGKTTLLNAHMPFIPFRDRPISIDEGSREVRLPHETGVSLTTRDHESEYKQVTMADLMTECNYLNPDVEVLAEINTPASFETFAESLNTGHGIIGTTHAEDVEKLVNRVVEQGMAPYLLRELDLVVFPRHVGGDRYVGDLVEFLTADEFEHVDGECGVVKKQGDEIYWNRIGGTDQSGRFTFEYAHPKLETTVEAASIDWSDRSRATVLNETATDERQAAPDGGEFGGEWGADDERECNMRVFHALARRTDRPVGAVEAEFHRKHRYVRYLRRDGANDFEELFEFLADLRTNEAATVERASTGPSEAADE